MRSLSAAAYSLIEAEAAGEIVLTFVEITHRDLATPLRYVSGTDQPVYTDRTGFVSSSSLELSSSISILSTGEVTNPSETGTMWTPAPFDVAPPADGDRRAPSTRLRVPAVDQVVMQALADRLDPPLASVHWALASSPDTVEVGPFDMRVRDARGATMETVLELTYEDILGRAVIPYRYDVFRTPALHK